MKALLLMTYKHQVSNDGISCSHVIAHAEPFLESDEHHMELLESNSMTASVQFLLSISYIIFQKLKL